MTTGRAEGPPPFFETDAVNGSLTRTDGGIQAWRRVLASPEWKATVNGVTRNARLRCGFALGGALAALLCASAVFAQQRPALFQFDGEAPVKAFAAQRGGISLSQATAMAQSRYPGRVVRAESVMIGDRVVHEIRILGNDGRVRTVRVDAQTGAFL